MTHEVLAPDCVLYAEDEFGFFANACIVYGTLVAPCHVAAGNPLFLAPRTGEAARVPLKKVPQRVDLAYSNDLLTATGFEVTSEALVGESLSILGYRGQDHTPFEIIVTVLELLPNGRIKVQRLSGEKAAVGMSGSPAVNIHGELVGILVAGVENSPDNEQLYLESIANLDLGGTL